MKHRPTCFVWPFGIADGFVGDLYLRVMLLRLMVHPCLGLGLPAHVIGLEYLGRCRLYWTHPLNLNLNWNQKRKEDESGVGKGHQNGKPQAPKKVKVDKAEK